MILLCFQLLLYLFINLKKKLIFLFIILLIPATLLLFDQTENDLYYEDLIFKKEVQDIDNYLRSYGFKRIATYWLPGAGWGDALYVKKGITKYSQLRKVKIFYRELKYNYLSEFRLTNLIRFSKKIVRTILRLKSA